MRRRMIPLFLSLAMALACLAGCADNEIRSYTPTAAPSPTTDAGDDQTDQTQETVDRDYAAAYAAYDPDTLVVTIDGLPVTWHEYFYWLQSCLYTLDNYYGAVTDWDAACALDESMTYREFIQQYALDTLVQYRALESHANQMGVVLDEEDEASLEEQWQTDVETYGGGDEEAFLEYLDSLFVGQELYQYINQMTCQYYNCFEEMYGEMGEKLADEDVLAYAENAGCMKVKHILFSTVDDGGEPVSDEVKAEKLQQATDLIAQLQAAPELEAAFDEQMQALSEDPGTDYYPDGYCFVPGTMYQEFEDAAAALAPGEMSAEPVETDAGYHIILRLDLSPEDEELQSGASLRYLAALNMYDSNVGSWLEEADVTFEPAFETLDVAALF